MITIYTSEEIEKIAAAGKLTADTLSMLEKAVRPGISTLELDEMAEKFIRSRGGIPSCKGYEGISRKYLRLCQRYSCPWDPFCPKDFEERGYYFPGSCGRIKWLYG